MSTLQYILTTILSPFLSLILYILNLGKKIPSTKDIWITVFIISLIGIYWFPWGDNQTHFAIYQADHASLYYTLLSGPYDIILKFFADLTGQYVWGYFFWLFVPLSLYLWLVWKSFYSQNPDRQSWKIVFVYLILFIGIREFLDLNRNTAAILLYVSALLLFSKNRIISLAILFLSLILHSSMAVILLMTVVIYFFTKKITTQKILLYSVLALVLSFLATEILIMFGSEHVIERYVTGQWGKGGEGVQSGFMKLMHYVTCFSWILIFIFVTKNIRAFKNRWLLSTYLSASMMVIVFILFYTIRERYIIASCVIGSTLILVSWNDLKQYQQPNKLLKRLINLSLIKILLVISVTYSSYFVHKGGSENPIEVTKIVSHSFYYPTPLLLDIEKHGFSNERYYRYFERTSDIR